MHIMPAQTPRSVSPYLEKSEVRNDVNVSSKVSLSVVFASYDLNAYVPPKFIC